MILLKNNKNLIKSKPLFIAEVSSNHQCDLERCFDFIETAASIGCQAVKFQLFKIDQLFSKEVLEKSEKHRARKDWELPVSFIPKLAQRCKDLNILFSCTPFYLDAVTELEPYVDFYKVASYELLWDELLIRCAKTTKPVILSTGMANIDEILHAVEVLKSADCSLIILLHCVSSYPTNINDANLSAIKTIRDLTGEQVGWSDHTVEPAVIYRAIHRWDATCIEFHLDLDKKGGEYESGHCWLPSPIKNVIENINKSLNVDGTGEKVPTKTELKERLRRADPTDGLRPLKAIRKTWEP